MKNITMIAAVGRNLELGKDNDLIWHFREDMKFFKEKTMGKPVVMGYKTLESLPKLLPGRLNIVLTSRNLELNPAILVVHSIDELLEKVMDYPEVMIIGGASVYKQMLPYSDKMYLTEIDAEAEADAYFPSFDHDDWDGEILSEHQEKDVSYKHLVYTRKR